MLLFPFFSKISEKCEKIQKSVKKSHELNIALCDLKLNQNGPSIWGLVWFNMGLIGGSVFACLFFLTQFFRISKYWRNLAGRWFLEGSNAKFENALPVCFNITWSFYGNDQRNTNLRLLFNIYKTRKNPSQAIIDKFRAISGI